MRPRSPRPRHRAVVALLLTALVLILVDTRHHDALAGPRAVVAGLLGPVQVAGSALTRPFVTLARTVRTNGQLRHHVAVLESQNDQLKSELASTPLDRRRLAAYDGLTRTAEDTGYSLVPAHVVGVGATRNFSRVVTIDAGRLAGVRVSSTVLTGAGLVGRVIATSATTATVLLICDADSVVGGRLASSMKVGFVHGDGELGDRARLRLELIDTAVTPARGDAVVSWGSTRGGPYVARITIGTVESVRVSERDSSKRATLRPAVDFGALDLVGVVVTADTHSDRSLIIPARVHR